MEITPGISGNMLFWSFLLLSFVQGVAAIVVSILCRDYLVDANAEIGLRQAVHLYYGTFTRSFLTMFEAQKGGRWAGT